MTNHAVHLHVHSEYSMLDGACNVSRLAERAAELGMGALGLTDHGVMNGAVEFYKACKAQGIKPVLGMEAYFVDDRTARGTGRFERNHLTLLAQSDEGFANLVRLTSAGFLEGFRRGKPNLDLDLLAAHSEGVICLSGCLQSRFARRLVEQRPVDARAHVDDLVQVFGLDNVYFEVQQNGIPEQDLVNRGAEKVAREMGRPLVGTADVHYLRREDYDHHAALLCVQTKSTLENPKIRFDTNEFYLKDSDEMAAAFTEWPDALPTTVEIADRCQVEPALGGALLPTYPCPDGNNAEAYLKELAVAGLAKRYGDPPPSEAMERLLYELDVIERMGFASYFLIVWDFVKYAKDTGIAVGPGRGSAAGSITSYCLNITEVDPLKYGLLFERFLNPERKSMPDIDIDFSTGGRDRVIRYVADKYGSDSVAQIVTFGKMAPKAATRDAGRVLGYPYGEVDRLAKLIPDPVMGRNPTFKDCLAPGQDLRKACDSDPDAKKIVDLACGLEGIVRNSSIHAAAVVIADRPLTELVPLQLAEDKSAGSGERDFKVVTQYSMGPIEDIGLLKMDFLGLRNLDVIESARRIVGESTGHEIDLDSLVLDDPKTYEMLSRGDSVGVFQMESEGMREALKRVKPTEFEDLVALVALYRPGAMRYIDDYAKGKRNPKSVSYLDERLKPITESTYGVTLYQEQNMEIAKQIAGFSGPEADDLRKAIGKKKRDLMATMRPAFIDGCVQGGTDRKTAERLWEDNTAAADYSFNKSHAACYALISYRTAYLKANYPAEYMAAVISSVMNTKDKVPFFVTRCEEMGIRVLPPDINDSGHDFVVVEGDIRFGLDAVKNVGHAAVRRIAEAKREGGPFVSIWDFCRRVDLQAVNKRALESLIKCGAFDSTGASRKGLLEILPMAQASGQRAQEDRLAGQGSLLSAFDAPEAQADQDPPVPSLQEERSETLAWERETLGLFVSSHPLHDVREELRARTDCSIGELGQRPDRSNVRVAGLVTELTKHRTKKGEPMVFATIDDLTGSVETIVFSSAASDLGEVLQIDRIVLARGRLDHKDQGEIKLIAQEVEVFEPSSGGGDAAGSDDNGFGGGSRVANGSPATPERAGFAAGVADRPASFVRLRVDGESFTAGVMSELKSIFERFRGDSPVLVEVTTETGKRTLRLSEEYHVSGSDALAAELLEVLGASAQVAV